MEGLILDPVYTGKAMAGLIGWTREGRFTDQHSVLFWHTGGAPALFAGGYCDWLTSAPAGGVGEGQGEPGASLPRIDEEA